MPQASTDDDQEKREPTTRKKLADKANGGKTSRSKSDIFRNMLFDGGNGTVERVSHAAHTSAFDMTLPAVSDGNDQL